MNFKKILLMFILSTILLGVILHTFIGSPVIVDISANKIETTSKMNYQKGDTINPFKEFDFSKDTWKVYLFIASSDLKEINGVMPKGKCFKTTDIELLKQIQREWKFIVTDGDVATVESSIVVCKNGKKVYSSGIVLGGNRQGLQNRELGWVTALSSNMMIEQCKQFERIYLPVFIR
jgi:hypothetical protein